MVKRPDGSGYEGDWKTNLKEGKGVRIRADGSRRAGRWVAGDLRTKKKTKVEQAGEEVEGAQG